MASAIVSSPFSDPLLDEHLPGVDLSDVHMQVANRVVFE